jgi:S-adenosylmethionine synthetase
MDNKYNINDEFFKTSEAVSKSHPDKVCDVIADSIYQFLRTRKNDPQSAVEVSAGANKLFIFGEIDTEIVYSPKYALTDNIHPVKDGIHEVARINPQLCKEITAITVTTLHSLGYLPGLYSPEIVFNLVTQSTEINNAVEAKKGNTAIEATSGDQGIVSGFATKETVSGHALHFILSHRILEALEGHRETGNVNWLLPDAKSQVTIRYRKQNGVDIPVAVETVLLSHSHKPDIPFQKVQTSLQRLVTETLTDVLAAEGHPQLVESLKTTRFLINPAGPWTTPGPKSDSGLTGRKIVVDNYGSAAPVGGGSTAGKNSSKVDRSGAYFARQIAKSVTASGLAAKVQVELGFAIGVAEPVSFNIETFGTETVPLSEVYERVLNKFTLTVQAMKDLTDLTENFTTVAEHGNYTNNTFPWEQTKQL